jgi:hypothetical protein
MRVVVVAYLMLMLLSSASSAGTLQQQGEEGGRKHSSNGFFLSGHYLDLSESLASSSLFASLDNIRGPGGKINGIQYFSFDERNRDLYSLNLNIAKNGNRSTINRYPLDGDRSKQSEGFSTPLGNVVGHQGLGLEYLPEGGVRLWSTYYKDFRQVARYSYSDGAPVGDVQIYRLFGVGFRPYVSSTPTISLDQKFIVAAGKKKGETYQTVRVWRLADLVANGGGDYSKSWLYEWDLRDLIGPQHPLQGIASDGKRIWIIAGSSKINEPKRLGVYSLEGRVLDKDDNMTVGRAQALLDGVGKVYEPEGLALIEDDGKVYLCIGIVSGDKGFRHARIYKAPLR